MPQCLLNYVKFLIDKFPVCWPQVKVMARKVGWLSHEVDSEYACKLGAMALASFSPITSSCVHTTCWNVL